MEWETFRNANTVVRLHIKKKKKKKLALKSVISVEVKSINSNILELVNCHLLLFFYFLSAIINSYWVLIPSQVVYIYI